MDETGQAISLTTSSPAMAAPRYSRRSAVFLRLSPPMTRLPSDSLTTSSPAAGRAEVLKAAGRFSEALGRL